MITTPEIICDVFSFLDKDQIERIQLVSQFWNNVIIRHKNILSLRQFLRLAFFVERSFLLSICLYATKDAVNIHNYSYIINFDGTNLSKGNVSSRYLQLTVDEVLTNLNDVVFYNIHYEPERLDNLLNMMKLVTRKTGARFRGKFGDWFCERFGSKLNEIFGKGFLNIVRYKIYPN
jgi:hypothetical protein